MLSQGRLRRKLLPGCGAVLVRVSSKFVWKIRKLSLTSSTTILIVSGSCWLFISTSMTA
ncbi:MAG: hypothetical protein ABSC08_00270 [Bryobacteraceae bacterium]|jgi:hypothetical protein